MGSRRMKIMLVSGALLALLLWAVFKPDKEPVYKDNKLSYWVMQADRQYGFGRTSTGATYEEAADAIRNIGSNAVPFLLKWSDYRTPEWQSKLHRLNPFLVELGVSWRIGLGRKGCLSWASVYAWSILGMAAEPAAPALTRRLLEPKDDLQAQRAALALRHLGPKGGDAFFSGLTNRNTAARLYSAVMIDVQASRGSNFSAAIPRLVACLQDPESRIAENAASALEYLRGAPEVSIPALIKAVADPRGPVHDSAIRALGAYGSEASNAVPALKEAAKSANFSTRQMATNSIRRIDPSALKN